MRGFAATALVVVLLTLPRLAGAAEPEPVPQSREEPPPVTAQSSKDGSLGLARATDMAETRRERVRRALALVYLSLQGGCGQSVCPMGDAR